MLTDTDYPALNLVSDSGPEVIAAQYDCPSGGDCASRPVYAQVFTLGGTEVGCTRNYSRLDGLPGYPSVALTSASLRPC